MIKNSSMYKNFIFFILAISTVFLSSCSSKDSPKVVTAIKLSASTMSLKVGESSELTVSYSPSNLEAPNYTWSSSNESVATVKDGNVTAISEGTATITVSAPGLGLSDVCTVTVSPITPTSVTLNMVKDTVIIGQTFTLTATVSPQNAKDKTVIWSSSNENVATVSSSGVVETKSVGAATITATTKEGNFTANCEVVVRAVPVTGITLNKSTLSLVEGEETTLTATVLPNNAGDTNITWSSSEPSVVSVSSNKLTAIKQGTATITVKTEDGGFTATCTVTVKPDNNVEYNPYNNDEQW